MKYLILLLLLIPTALATVSSNTDIIDTTWTIGDSQPSIQNIIFTSSVEDTVSLSVSGNASAYISLSSQQLTFTNSTLTRSISLSYSLPSAPGIYRGSISYRDGDIPVYLFVQEREVVESSGCKLKPITATDYIQTVKQGASPFSQKFIVRVSSDCEEPVDISAILPLNTIQLEDGTRPIRLQGALSLGEKDPGDDVSFDVVVDVTGLDSGVIYSPTLRVVGTYKDNPISTEINFRITVTKGASPGIISGDEPEVEIPSTAVEGKEFQIIVSKLDPNMQPQMVFNPLLIGHKVERIDDKWLWTGSVNNTGEVDIEVFITHFGGQIGQPTKKKMLITSEAVGGKSETLRFDFFPGIDTIVDNGDINILLRDNQTNNIVKGDIYVNGVKIDANTVNFKMGDKYCLSAVASGYRTLDQCIEINPQALVIEFDPSNPQIGQTLVILVKNPRNGEELNVKTIKVNGESNSGTFKIEREGTFTVEASAEGFISTNKSFSITDELRLVTAPILEKNKVAAMSMNKNVSWQVTYRPSVDKPEELLIEGTSNTIEFIPYKKGLYSVYGDEKLLQDFTLGKQSSGNYKIYLWIIGILLVVFIVVIILRRRGGQVGMGSVTELPGQVTEGI